MSKILIEDSVLFVEVHPQATRFNVDDNLLKCDIMPNSIEAIVLPDLSEGEQYKVVGIAAKVENDVFWDLPMGMTYDANAKGFEIETTLIIEKQHE